MQPALVDALERGRQRVVAARLPRALAPHQRFEAGVQAANRPGIDALVARLRERQAQGNVTLAAALAHVGESDLHGRLLSLADGAEGLVA